MIRMGECFFWYRPTRVVLEKRPLNGCRCCCCSYPTYYTSFITTWCTTYRQCWHMPATPTSRIDSRRAMERSPGCHCKHITPTLDNTDPQSSVLATYHHHHLRDVLTRLVWYKVKSSFMQTHENFFFYSQRFVTDHCVSQ